MTTWPPSIPSDYSPLTKLLASDLNIAIDALEHLGSAWDSYTPTLEATTTDPDYDTAAGGFKDYGKTLHFWAYFLSGPVGTGGDGDGTFLVGLPSGVTLTGSLQQQIVSGGARVEDDSGATIRHLECFGLPYDSTRFKVAVPATTGGEWITHEYPWRAHYAGHRWIPDFGPDQNSFWIAGTIEVD